MLVTVEVEWDEKMSLVTSMYGYGKLFSFWTADSWTITVEMCPSITSKEGCSTAVIVAY